MNILLAGFKEDKTKISDEVQKLLVDKPVIDLSVKVGDKEINTLDKRITVSIPYQPTADEMNKSEHLVIQYVDSNGKLVTIPNGKYNKETGTVEFRTDKPGNYGVGFIESIINKIVCLPSKTPLDTSSGVFCI